MIKDMEKFARIISFITHNANRELDIVDIQHIHNLVEACFQPQILANRPTVAEADVNELMKHMAEKKDKIAAIKAYRQITNADLRTSKDAVERYW